MLRLRRLCLVFEKGMGLIFLNQDELQLRSNSTTTAAVALAEQGNSDNGVINPEVPPRI